MKQLSLHTMRHRTLVFILILVSYFFLMWMNGFVSWTHPDEVFYTQTAKEMLARKEWLTPYIFDEPQFEKPFLFYVLMAVAIKLFGMVPFVCRFWPAFFATVGVVVTYWVSWMLYENKRVSFLSGLMLSTSFIYMALSRAILTDMVFSVLVVISIAFFYYGYKYADKKNVGIILFFVVAAIAVLTKGFLGFCFPLGTVLIFLIVKKDLKFLVCRATLGGFLLFLIIAAPWHLYMYKMYGQKFIDHYWYNVHIRRLFVAEHKRLDNWYFYFMLLFLGIMPWTFFSFSACGKMIREIRLNEYGRRDQFLFLLSWIAGILLFIQPAKSKLASYIFPAFPAMIMMVGYYMGHSIDKTEGITGNSLKAIGTALSLAMVVGIGVGLYFAQKHIDIVVSMVPVYVTSTLVFIAAVCIFVFIRKKKIIHMVFSVASLSAILLVTLFLGKPYTEPWVSCKDICDIFKKKDTGGSVVLASKFYVRGIRFYTDRDMAVIDLNGEGFFTPHPIPFLNTDKKIKDFLKSQPVTWCVIRNQDIKAIERIMFGTGYTVKQYEDIGGKYIVKVAKEQT